MAFIEAPNSARVELRYTCLSQKVENTLWFEHTSALPGADELQTLANTVGLWWADNLRPLQSTATTLREVYARQWTLVGNEWTEPATPPLNSGTLESEPLPNNVTLCVSFRTGFAGRSYRGRNYPVGLTRTFQSGNFSTASYAEDLQAAYAALLPAMEGTGWQWVVMSLFFDKHPRATGVTTPVGSVTVTDLALDSQRRRLVGRGQ